MEALYNTRKGGRGEDKADSVGRGCCRVAPRNQASFGVPLSTPLTDFSALWQLAELAARDASARARGTATTTEELRRRPRAAQGALLAKCSVWAEHSV